MKILIRSILIALTAISLSAQNSTFFNGNVYVEDSVSGKQTMIPFATIKISRINNPSKTLAVRISGLNGSYEIKGFDTDSTYIVTVKAPGVQTQSFVTKPNNGRFKSGNLSAHLRLEVNGTYGSPVKKQSFAPADVSVEKETTLVQMIAKIPGLTLENDEIATTDGGSVRLMINGFNPIPDLYTKIKDFPASEVVKTMDYHDLTKCEGSAYDGVLNIRIAVGNEATEPDYKLVSLKTYQK